MKKRKLLSVLSVTAILSLSLPTLSYAGEWKQDNNGWWWVYDNGSYPISKWEWIDGNHDNVAECYYFGTDGYMLSNVTTPDNYNVNVDGAWIVNGVVQTKVVYETSDINSYSDSVGTASIDIEAIRPSDMGSTKEVENLGGDNKKEAESYKSEKELIKAALDKYGEQGNLDGSKGIEWNR